MTHIYFITRGRTNHVQEFVNEMNSVKFNVPMLNEKTKKVTNYSVQGAMRPVTLWEYVCPKGGVDFILNSLDIPNRTNFAAKVEGRFKWLRRLLKLKPIPQPDPFAGKGHIVRDHVSIHPIGIKEDQIGSTTNSNITHERL